MKMKSLEDIRAELMQSMQKAHSNDTSNTGNASKINALSKPEALQKASQDAQDALTAAVNNFLAQSSVATTTTATAPATASTATRGKRIKEKGIALCHESQGYSANLRPNSLLMKAGKPGISLQVNKSALVDASPELLATLKRLGFETNI